MFLDILKFEINFHRRQNLVYILSGVFFLITFAATTTPNVQLVGGLANINLNSPYAIVMTMGSALLFALFGSVAFSANAVIRDFEYGTAELFLSRPIPKFDYVYGRFAGTLIFAYIIFFAALLGMMVGEFMPWLDQERLGDFSLSAYVYAVLVLGIPSLFVLSSLFFFIATLTRSMLWTYVGVVVLLMLSLVLDTFTEKETVELTSILDPFGTTAIEEATRYWTAFEKNTQLPELQGPLVANRLFWLTIGLVSCIGAYFAFPFSIEQGSRRTSKKSVDVQEKGLIQTVATPQVTQQFDLTAQFLQFLQQTKLEVRNVVISVPFIAVLFLGLLIVIANTAGGLESAFGTPVYATTYTMVQVINGAFTLSLMIVLIYYAGEIMVRERGVNVAEIMDAMPYPNWVMIAAKLTGLITVIICMLLSAMLAGICVQLYNEFYEIDLSLYLKGLLFFFQIPLYLMVVLALFFFTLTRNKYLTMFLMILYFVVNISLPALGFEHFLYRMRQLQPLYSDFTGYSQNLAPYLWQTLYWGLFGCLMLIVVHLLWPRGTDDSISARLRIMRQRMTLPVILSGSLFTLAWIGVGGFIYYNTVVLNPYITSDDLEDAQAAYEKSYKIHQFKPMPSIQEVYAEVDIYPSRRELKLKGRYEMTNTSGEPQTELHFTLPPLLAVKKLEVPGSRLDIKDKTLGYSIYKFDNPLLPGQAITVNFEVEWLTPGFSNQGHSVQLTENGTFVSNSDFFPQLGYQSGNELIDNNLRRKYALPPVQRQSKIDDHDALNRAGFVGARVKFETIISTSLDQIALAPGYIQREWTEAERRYFHYKMDAPIWNFYSFMSADYEVKRDSWNDVAIEVYYKHDYNVDTMIQSAKASLDYFTTNFSNYQYDQFRIVEFPGFQGRFAQSFPNTIPFSESIGFTADLRDKTKIDYVYYVTAHELAHQWWAHQVIGADVQGQTMIVESLAQYSALMVMETAYGKDQMKRFLAYEMDRYLSNRGSELIEELPLYLVENQPYIHYSKGSVVLYALKDYLGEQVVNTALKKFVQQYAFKGAPYPTTKNLIALIREETDPKHEAMINDLLERIVIYDLEVADVNVTPLEGGKFDVSIDVSAGKFEADGAGMETAIPIDDWIEIGVLGKKQGDYDTPEVLHLEKYHIDGSKLKFSIIVDKEPASVGIDPLNKLIDRNPDDNVIDV